MLLSIGPRAASRRYSAGLSLREGSLGLGDGVLNRGEERLARDGGAGHAVDVGGVSLYDLAGAVKVRDGLAVAAEHPRASERRSKYPASRPKPALPTCTPSSAYITRTTYWITLTSELRGGRLSQKGHSSKAPGPASFWHALVFGGTTPQAPCPHGPWRSWRAMRAGWTILGFSSMFWSVEHDCLTNVLDGPF